MRLIPAVSGFVVATATFVFLMVAPAYAQATRTWVSGVGDDANPCSRTSPCKTFAGAMPKTAASGEISVLDPGGFGPVTITKAITLVAEGVEGGVLASGTSGITINAGVNDNVAIRGLTIEGAGTGTAGIRILQANNIYIANTVVRGFTGASGYGIDIEPAGSGARIYLKNVEIYNNLTGVYLHAGAALTGVAFDGCNIAANPTNAAMADTSTSVFRANGSSFAGSPLLLTGGAQLITEQNNFFANGSSSPTSISALQ